MSIETYTEADMESEGRDYLLGQMALHHEDWQDARYHLERSGGNSASRVTAWQREERIMNELLDLYVSLGHLATENPE